MMETGGDIREKFEHLKTKRGQTEETWQSIARHTLGSRTFNEIRTPGEERMRHVYDTTAMLSGELLTQTLHGTMFNPASSFCFLDVYPKEARRHPANFQWLANAEAMMDFSFKMHEFGFSSAIAESLFDGTHFGSVSVMTEHQPGFGPRYSSRPLGEVHFAENNWNQVDTTFRLYKITNRQFVQEFGEEADADITRKAPKEPHTEFDMLQVVHPRKDIDRRHQLAADSRPWRSAYVVRETSKIVREGGYWTSPYANGRISKENYEIYGRGPGWKTLSDQRMLNLMSKVLITHAQKLVAPPYLVPDEGILSHVDMAPDSMVTYRAHMFQNDPITLMPVSDKTVITEKLIAQRQDMVKRGFYAHLLGLFDEGSPTATQYLGLEHKAARILVSHFSRVATEVAAPVVFRTLDVLERGQFLPPRPPTMRGVLVRPEYLSPIYRAQRAEASQEILNTWASGLQLEQASPGSIDNLDPDKSMRKIAENAGTLYEIGLSEEERDAIRAMRAKQQQEQARLAQVQDGAQAIGQAGPAIAQLMEASAP